MIDEHLFPVVTRHPVIQYDRPPEVMNVRDFHDSAIRDLWTPRGGNGEKGSGFPLIDLEIDAVAI